MPGSSSCCEVTFGVPLPLAHVPQRTVYVASPYMCGIRSNGYRAWIGIGMVGGTRTGGRTVGGMGWSRALT